MNTARFATFAIAAAAGAALTAHAGVKYWDKPGFRDYDVGDYVQDGLVVNYDGIRNQGPNAPHDSSAMTWVNCANPGTYDMTRYSLNVTSSATNWVAGDAKGSWADNGFVFNTNALFHQGTSFTVPATYTMQTLVDAKASKQTPVQPGKSSGDLIGYVMCDYGASHWSTCSIGIRRDNYNYNGTKYQYSFYLVTDSAGTARPAFGSGTDVTFDYATAIGNGSSGSVFFNGTEAPWSASGSQNGRSTAAVSSVTFGSGFSLGGHYPNVKEYFSGTIKNFRIYNRCLNDAEVLWNRVVDEARYFGRGREFSVIPATNVVEHSNIPGVRDYHYAIDAEGQTFTAPAQRTVNGRRYTFSGYTLETWNGSRWDSTSNSSDASYTATDPTALVRLTWQYTEAAGEGSLKTYDVGDYVDGALLHFDGIFNQGTNEVHNPVASTWKNLGSENYDLTLKNSPGTVLAAPIDGSYWSDDGFVYAGTLRFGNNTTRTWGPDYTVQVLADTTRASLKNQGGANYIFATGWAKCALSYYGQASRGLELHTQNASSGSPHYGPYLPAESLTYVTATLDSSNDSATIFTGTSVPSGTGLSNVTNYSFSVNSYTEGMNLGGWGGGGNTGASFFVGTIKNFRFYGRVLTEAELEQNRKVDEYRFFGRYVVTNVLVQSTYTYLHGNETDGPYEVDGSYTFTAPATVTAANGITYACDGYTVETWDGTKWTGATTGTGNSYLYNSTDTVRLTWRWKATSGLRSAANYGFDDYVTGGLKVHLDGLFNAGVGKPRTTANTTNTKWVNLGSNGADSDAKLTKGSDSSAWTDDGYYFDGKSKFNVTNIGVKASSSYTIQILSDVDRSLLRLTSDGKAQHNYLFSGSYNKLAVSVYGQGKPCLRAGVEADVTFSLATEEHLTYFTGMMDQSGASPVAYAFPGTTPASGTTSTAAGLTTPAVNNPVLGGWGGGNTQFLIGTIKNFRYYDRVLTEEELVRNRQVDSARYFSALAVTNVFVAVDADSTGITPAEAADTAYFVEGSHTFTVNDPPAGIGYRLSVPDGNGGWTASQSFTTGDSYTYDSETSPATVKLEWRVQKPFTMIIR